MERLVLLLVFSLPFYTVGIYFGGSFLSISHLFAVAVALLSVIIIARMSFLLPGISCKWVKPFLYFLILSIISLVFSPYGLGAWSKGGVQIVGIAVMILMGVGITLCIINRPEFLIDITRHSILGVSLLAVVGCLQFFLWNFTPFNDFLKFSFLNEISGGSAWRDPGRIGAIHRVNSFAAEPTHYVRFLGFAIGWALIRLGLLGNQLKNAMATVMPLSLALIVVLGFLFSLSINGAVLMIVCIAGLFLGSHQINIKRIAQIVGAGFIVVLMGYSLSLLTEGGLADKLNTVAIVSSGIDAASVADNSNLSALALASNIEVAAGNFLQNMFLGGGLGSHPVAYEVYAPLYVYDNEVLERLNAHDAASLFLRLLSETGLLGLLLFLGGWFQLMFLLKRSISSSISKCHKRIDVFMAVYIGLFGSMAGVFFLYLLRTGHYYDPVLWVMVSLVAIAPYVLKATKTGSIKEELL